MKAGPQALGAAATYLRRYALASMVGVAAGDDDDGDGLSGGGDRGQKRKPPKQKHEEPPIAAPVDAAVDFAARSNEDHDADWTTDRTWFCSGVTRYGLTYDDLRAYRLAHGWRKPSTIGTTERGSAPA